MLRDGFAGFRAPAQRVALQPALQAALTLVLAGLLVLGPGYLAAFSVYKFDFYKNFANNWTVRDRMIRQAVADGQRSVTVARININNPVGDLRLEPDFWINQAAAQYYGIDEIIAK